MTDKVVCKRMASDDREEEKAFQEAIKDQELRKEIILILKEAGLLGALPRQPD